MSVGEWKMFLYVDLIMPCVNSITGEYKVENIVKTFCPTDC